MSDRVRVLNTKTGEVKFIPAHIAKNEKLLKAYNLEVQDLRVKEEEKTLTLEEDALPIDVKSELTDDMIVEEKEEDLIEDAKPKRGRKPNK